MPDPSQPSPFPPAAGDPAAAVSPRDRHLFGPGPKRLLSLDGGGVRGALTVAFLERIEALLDARYGSGQRLCDHFDLVGGTSTGSIIAGALALGYRASDVRDFYVRLAPRVFRRPFWRLQGLQAKFDARALKREIDEVIGARTLDSDDLSTGFALVAKRMDTASPWILSNDPRAPYWETPADGLHIGNRHYRLGNLVRASTAAPHYFDPELLPIVEGEPPGTFVDGGVTPHNDPSFALFTLTQAARYGLRWRTGPDDLTIVSIGTGFFLDRLSHAQALRIRPIVLAIRALAGLIRDTQRSTLALMQWLGECPAPWPINSEIGTLADEHLAGAPLFRFHRFDVVLEPAWLRDTVGGDWTEAEVRRLRAMDAPEIVPRLYELGVAVAERQVPADLFAPRPA
jgi:hypothetical protein